VEGNVKMRRSLNRELDLALSWLKRKAKQLFSLL